jgi:ABC-2 type transport system permease protein
MHRMMAIIERDLRRFRRSPMLIVMSLLFPIVQLVVLGHAGHRRSGSFSARGKTA